MTSTAMSPLFNPQQRTLPSPRTAQLCSQLVDTAVAPVIEVGDMFPHADTPNDNTPSAPAQTLR